MISENENSIIFDCFVLFSFFLFLYNESQRNPKQYWTLGCTILKKKQIKKHYIERFLLYFFFWDMKKYGNFYQITYKEWIV